MSHPPPALSKRERQILDVIYRRGRASASDIHAVLPDAPTYTTVRGLLRVLERKGHIRHETLDRRFVYTPSAPSDAAGVASLRHVVRTFFQGSTTRAVAALLGSGSKPLSAIEVKRLEGLLDRARRRSNLALDPLKKPFSPKS